MLENVKKMAVDQDVVNQAADALLIRGERPTIERVRAEIGRGSPNTVNRFLDVWWSQLAKRIARPGDGHQQETLLPAPLMDACRQVYAAIAVEVKREADADAYVAQQQFQAERDELLRQSAEIDQEREVFKASAAMMDTLRHELAMKTAAHEAVLDSLRLAQAETQKVIAADGAQKAELLRVREQASGNERRFLREIDELRTRVKTSEASRENQVSRLEKQLSEATDMIERLRVQMADITAELQRERETRISAEAEAAGMRRAIPPGAGALRRVRPGSRPGR